VANLSLGGPANLTLDEALRQLVRSEVVATVAAGNSNADACQASPARVAEALTVGATDSTDTRASFSNWGACLDLFAPGVAVSSAYYTSATATRIWSGTSMAAPHVAGVGALYLQQHGSTPPAEVADSMSAYASKAVVINASSMTPHLVHALPVVDPPSAGHVRSIQLRAGRRRLTIHASAVSTPEHAMMAGAVGRS
jgi:subtilisin family serine protease